MTARPAAGPRRNSRTPARRSWWSSVTGSSLPARCPAVGRPRTSARATRSTSSTLTPVSGPRPGQSQARSGMAAATAGRYALFAGGTLDGYGGDQPTDVVDVYDSATGKWSVGPPLGEARQVGSAVTAGTTAMFAWRVPGGDNAIDFYTAARATSTTAGGTTSSSPHGPIRGGAATAAGHVWPE